MQLVCGEHLRCDPQDPQVGHVSQTFGASAIDQRSAIALAHQNSKAFSFLKVLQGGGGSALDFSRLVVMIVDLTHTRLRIPV